MWTASQCTFPDSIRAFRSSGCELSILPLNAYGLQLDERRIEQLARSCPLAQNRRGAILAPYGRGTHEWFPRRNDYGQPDGGGRRSLGAYNRCGCKRSGERPSWPGSESEGFLAALGLLAMRAVCYTLELEKSALLALLLVAKLGGQRGAWQLRASPPSCLPGYCPRMAHSRSLASITDWRWRFPSLGRSWAAWWWKGINRSIAGLRPRIRIGKQLEDWCRRGESNPRPRDYETLALPLSYAGMMVLFMLRTRRRMCQGVVSCGPTNGIYPRR